jgi:membrane protease YdiL (CAAX protease family)
VTPGVDVPLRADVTPAPDVALIPPEPPRSGGTFSLEGRPAAGLYLFGWLLTAIGFGLLFVAVQTRPPIGGLLLMGALLVLFLGLASAAGYQIVARRTRPASMFHGASPLLLLGLQLVVSIAFGTAWLALGLPDPGSSSVGFLVISVTLLASYFLVVWLFGVRSGALTWQDLGIPAPASFGRLLGDIGFGTGVMIIVWPIATGLAAILATLLGSSTPDIVPPVQTPAEILLTALAAGILVPIGEELLFRGYSLTAWLRDLGPRSALIRSTLFFAFAHILSVTATSFDSGVRQALLTVVVITPVGAALGWIFLRRGLVASIAGHATFNLIGVVLLALTQLFPLTPPAG